MVAITFSGHGYSLSASEGYSVLITQELGIYSDDDMQAALNVNPAVGNIFLFLHACRSGGFGEEVMSASNADSIWMSTAATANQDGYEVPELNQGLWVYYFLEEGLNSHFSG